jgi:DinB superfamily/Pentapeptide repeats (8 copies)
VNSAPTLTAVPKDVADTEFRGARFTRVDLSGATFRDVDLSDVRILDAILDKAEISGMIGRMRVNGVEVAPLVEAELDRRHPERVLMRATTAAGLRDGWAAVEEMWAPTIELAAQLPEDVRNERVDGEWSLVETLRHLIFVTDAWFGRAVLGESHPYHRLGLVPAFLGDGSQLGLDPHAAPSFDEVLDARNGRMARVRQFLESATDDDLAQRVLSSAGDGYPPAGEQTVLACLHVVTDEEWNHHQYATRDLALLTR